MLTETERKRIHGIYADILTEREHQEALKIAGKFRYTCADVEMVDTSRACVLTEETGEVCRAVLSIFGLTKDTPEKASYFHLRRELVQVAAVAVAWIEGLDKESESRERLQL